MSSGKSGDRSTGTVLVVFGIALLVRLVYVLEFSRSVFFSSPTLDAAFHDETARRIAAGHLLDGAPYFRAPFYSWFLALLYAIGGPGPWLPRIVQCVLGATAAAGIAWCTVRIAGWKPGLIAGLAMALYGPLVFAAGELLHEALLVPLLVAAAVCFVYGQEELDDPDAGVLPWFLGALFVGLAAITRPSALVLVPVVLFLPLFVSKSAAAGARARRLVFPVLFGVVLPVLPVTAINYITSGDVILVASQGGINFYAGNNAEADGRHVVVPELGQSTAWGDFVPVITAKAQDAAKKKLRQSEVSGYWTSRGLSWLAANPGKAFGLYVKKTGALFSGYEVPNNRDIYVAKRESRLLGVLVGRAGPLLFPWGLFLPLALFGLGVSSDRRHLFFFWGSALAYALSVLPFFVADRFRLPIVPFLAPLAGIGIATLPGILRAPGRAAVPIGVFAATLVVANLPFGVDTRGNPADGWHKLGEALYNKGNYPAALEAFSRAIELAPNEDLPRLGRAWTYESMGEDSLGADDFRIAASHLPDSWQAQYGYGQYLVRQKRTKEAIPFLERAAGLMPDRAELHRELGFAYEETGNYPAAGLALAHALKLGDESADLHLSLGLAALHQGSPEKAEANWKRALELDPKHFRSLYNLGLLRFGQGKGGEALDLWRRAADAAPKDPLPHFQMARAFLQKGDRERALQEVREAEARGLDPREVAADPILRNLSVTGPAESSG